MQCSANQHCNKQYTKDGENYTIVCEGWLNSDCSYHDNSTTPCNSFMNYKCADWIQGCQSKHQKCVDHDPSNDQCSRSMVFENEKFNLTCQGTVGDKCVITSDCDEGFGYKCADWVDKANKSAGIFC